MSTFYDLLYGDETELFRFDLIAGRTYYIEAEGLPTGVGSLRDPIAHIYSGIFNNYPPDPGWEPGDVLASDDDGGVGWNGRLIYTPTQSGTYFAAISSYGGSGGTYRLRAHEDDFRSSVEGVGAAGNFGATISSIDGTINYVEDDDLFTVTMIAGLTYTIDQHGAGDGGGTLGNGYLRLLRDAAIQIASNNDAGPGSDARLVHTADQTGVRYILAESCADAYAGSHRLTVGAGVATAAGDVVTGTTASDAIDGAGGGDVIRGGDGDDWLWGGTGNDMLFGDAGADTLRGQSGNDTLRGGRGADLLIGGTGGDTFVFAPGDAPLGAFKRIGSGDNAIAFEGAGVAGGDLLPVSEIDANVAIPGDQAFGFPNTLAAGTLRIIDLGTTTRVLGCVDNAPGADFDLNILDGAIPASRYAAIDFVL